MSESPHRRSWGWRHNLVMGVLFSMVIGACGGGGSDSTDIEPVATTIPITELFELPGATVRVDPAVLDAEETRVAVEMFERLLVEMPVRDPIDVILYGSSEESIDWAMETTKSLDCLYYEDRNLYGQGGWADSCGFIMAVDDMPADCLFGQSPCKNVGTVVAHEYFHIVTIERLEPCLCEPLILGKKIPNWYSEGIAEYVGYRSVFDSDPEWLDKVLAVNLERATRPEVSVGVVELEQLWAKGAFWESFQYLYERSLFVVAFLVERYGAEAVLETFFERLAEANEFTKGFEATFEVSVEQFSQDFLDWMTRY